MILGRRQIDAGGGFVVRARRAYGYRAGQQGATVLEFRKRHQIQQGDRRNKFGQVARNCAGDYTTRRVARVRGVSGLAPRVSNVYGQARASVSAL